MATLLRGDKMNLLPNPTKYRNKGFVGHSFRIERSISDPPSISTSKNPNFTLNRTEQAQFDLKNRTYYRNKGYLSRWFWISHSVCIRLNSGPTSKFHDKKWQGVHYEIRSYLHTSSNKSWPRPECKSSERNIRIYLLPPSHSGSSDDCKWANSTEKIVKKNIEKRVH